MPDTHLGQNADRIRPRSRYRAVRNDSDAATRAAVDLGQNAVTGISGDRARGDGNVAHTVLDHGDAASRAGERARHIDCHRGRRGAGATR